VPAPIFFKIKASYWLVQSFNEHHRHLGVMEAHQGVIETHLEPWRLIMEPWRLTLTPWRLPLELCVKAQPGVVEVCRGVMKDHPGATEADPEIMEAHL
jgi:hypothetical protein